MSVNVSLHIFKNASSLCFPVVGRFLEYLNGMGGLRSMPKCGRILLGGDTGWPITGVPKGEMRTAANPTPQCWKQNFLIVHCSKCYFFQLYKKCQRMAINIVTVLLFLAEYYFF